MKAARVRKFHTGGGNKTLRLMVVEKEISV
jgi:hypothetical protein